MNNNIINIIKYVSITLIAVILIILILQYPKLISAKNENRNLNNQLEELKNEYEQTEKYKQELYENKEILIEEFLREELNLIKNNETNINY